MSDCNYYDTALGVCAGYATKKYAEKLLKKPYNNYLNNYYKNQFDSKENQIFKHTALDAYTKNGLDKKGVEVLNIDLTNCDAECKRIYNTNANRRLKDFQKAANGKRAFYEPSTKSIVVNQEKRAISLFHEMGHAINHTSKGWKNHLHTVRNFSNPLAVAFLTLGLCTDKDNFFNENCGKLAYAALTPMIAEEALASSNGQKMAKSLLSSDMFKKLKTRNAMCLGSYIVGTAAISIASALGIQIKNKICEPN